MFVSIYIYVKYVYICSVRACLGMARKRKRELLEEEDSDAGSFEDHESDLDVGAMEWDLGAGDPTSGSLG